MGRLDVYYEGLMIHTIYACCLVVISTAAWREGGYHLPPARTASTSFTVRGHVVRLLGGRPPGRTTTTSSNLVKIR